MKRLSAIVFATAARTALASLMVFAATIPEFNRLADQIYSCVTGLHFVMDADGEINIEFKGVPEERGICFTSVEPAHAVIEPGSLPAGEHPFALHDGGVRQSGRIVVSKESCEAEFENSETFKFTNNRLQRI